ncbi:MAG TPA: hypothetical protein VNN17_06375, partial [Terriglobia bacterium]|nr:hypothetical protein [Terriglobia bacterium]
MQISQRIWSLMLLLGLANAAAADVLILKDGQAISGRFQGGDPGGITFLVDGQYRRYALTDIHSITILPVSEAGRSAAPAPATTGSSAAGSQTPSYSTGRSAQPAPPPAPYPPSGASSSGGTWSTRPATTAATEPPAMGITLPAGTVLTVRMIDPVDSSVHQTGETFRASLDEPVLVNGRTMIPRGASVTTKLVEVEQAGRISGRSELALILYDITVNGRKYEITTEEVSQQGASRGAQSAQRIGGLAAIG